MADFSNSTFGRAQRQPTPGQPVGLDQVQDDRASGRLQPWMQPTGSYVDNAQRWYTGANNEGMTNGWDTDFYRRASQQRGFYLDEAARTGDATKYLNWLDVNPNSPTYNREATGVALWNDPSAFGRGDGAGTKVGDVFDNGRWVRNVYEDFKDDRPTADLMLVDWVLEQDQKRDIWRGDDRREKTSQEMDKVFEQNTRDIGSLVGRQQFTGEIEARQADIQGGSRVTGWDIANVLGPAAAAAGTAATASAVPALFGGPVSPLIVAGASLVAGIGGGWAAWANQDNISYEQARAMEIIERSKERYKDADWKTNLTTGLLQWGPVLQSSINPLSNTVQGINDEIHSDIGDGKEGFYEIDPETGNRKAGGIAQGLNAVALFGDSIFQFTSPVGAGLYTTTMGATVVGGAGEIITRDAGFNLRTGQFEDYEGAKETVAAWGSVGIDAVQLLAGAGSWAMGTAARAGAGVEGASAGIRGGKPVIAGRVYTTDELGFATGKRFSIQMLAPSEAVRAVVVGQRARQLARQGGGGTAALTADDYYRAAKEITDTSRASGAFVTGISEGAEEAVQAVLEPASFSEDIDPGSVIESAVMGAAGGAGMHIGSTITGRAGVVKDRREQRSKTQARGLAEVAENRAITDEDWDARWGAMSRAEQRRATILDQRTASRHNATVKKITDDMAMETGATSIIGVLATNQFNEKGMEAALKDINPEATGMFQLQARPSHRSTGTTGLQQQVYGENTALMSLFEVANAIEQNFTLTQRNLDDTARDIDTSTKAGADLAAKVAGVQDRINNGELGLEETLTGLQNDATHTARVLKDLTAQQKDIALDRPMAEVVLSELLRQKDDFDAIPTSDITSRIAAIDTFNQTIILMAREAWDVPGQQQAHTPQEREAIRRAVELVIKRDPILGLSGYDLNIPQASYDLTIAGAHRIIETALQTFKPKNADADGDAYALIRDSYTTPALRQQLRRGIQFFAAASTHTETDDKGDVIPMTQVRESLGDQANLVFTEAANEAEIVEQIGWALTDPDQSRKDAAEAVLEQLRVEFRQRYVLPGQRPNGTQKPPVTGPQFTAAWKTFTAELTAGVPLARENFMNTMVRSNPVGFLEMADETYTREPVHIMARIFDLYETITTEGAANNAADQKVLTRTGRTRPIPGRPKMVAKAVQAAKTAGKTLQVIGSSEALRRFQQQHYGIYRSTTLAQEQEDSGFVPDLNKLLIEDYALLGGVTESEIEQIMNKYGLEDRVVMWLQQMLGITNLDQDDVNAMLLLAQSEVQNVGRDRAGNIVTLKGKTTVLQLLMRRSIEIERRRHEGKPEEDAVWGKLERIEGMTKEQGDHSYTAQTLLVSVFGGYNLHQLVGANAMYIGSQMSPDQMLRILMSQNLHNRRKTADRWKRMPGYVKETGLGDPPYTQADVEAGRINAFAIIVDAVYAAASTSEKQRDRTDKQGSEHFAKGFKSWTDAVDSWAQQNQERLVQEGKTTREQWVDDLLQTHPEWARPLVLMLPSQAHAAIFQDRDGKIQAAKWVRKVLTMTNAEEAEAMGFVYSQFALFNEKQGTSGLSSDGKPKVGDGKLTMSELESEFLRMMLMLQLEDPTRQELYRFVEVAATAGSLLGLRDVINKSPNWLRNNAPWHPYTNDSSAYESNVTDLFGGVSRDSKRMEELQKFAAGAGATRVSSTQHGKHLKQEGLLKTRMKDAMDKGSNVKDAKGHVKNLEDAVERKKLYPDPIGPALMSEFFGLIMRSFGRGHDKAEATEEANNMGLPTAFTNAFGLGTDIEQEMSALTSNDPENLLTNPTRLTRTPVRILNGSGSETVVTLDNARDVLNALDDNVLRPLGMAVVEPTVRDLNAQGGVTMYADRTEEGRPLEEILDRAAHFTDVFDENLPRVQRALRGIGLIEAALREEALTLSLDEQDVMNFPITRAISDFLGLYMTSPQSDKTNPEELYNRTIVAVWESLLKVAETPAGLRSSLQATLESAILDQWGDPLASFDLYASDPQKVLFNSRWWGNVIGSYTGRHTNLSSDLIRLRNDYAALMQANSADPAIPGLVAEIEFTTDQIKRLDETLAILQKQGGTLPRRLFASWESKLNKYQLTGDRTVDAMRKRAIADWLINGNQGNRFDGKKSLPLVEDLIAGWGDSALRVEILSNDTKYDMVAWNELGAMAAALEIEFEGAGLPASWTSAIPVGTKLNDPKSLNKYFDVSGASLAEPLFDKLILKAVERMLLKAGPIRRTESGYRTAVDDIRKRLYPPELVLGDWDSTVVKQAAWVQQLISGASVKITVPIGGDAGNRLGENVAAELATDGKAAATDYTLFESDFSIPQNESSSVSLFRAFPATRMENHFFDRIELTPKNGAVDSAVLTNFHRRAGKAVLADGGGTIGSHKLYSTAHIAMLIDELTVQFGMTEFTLKVNVVDVDKKPHTPEHINSPVFDGMGRDAIVGGYGSPLAAMFFGLGAIANITQQKPLDALKFAGQAFRGYLTTTFGTVQQLEQGSVREVIEKKTMSLWQKKYGFGFLLYGDIPAVYKWVKSRHLVSGFNPETQQQELWWSERYITSEARQEPDLLQNPQLISLNERTFKRLIGTINANSANGEVVKPAFKIQDVNRFPLLTGERLRKLGLSDLGKKAGLDASDVRQQGVLPVLRHRKAREATLSALDERSETWRSKRDTVLTDRDGVDASWSRERTKDIEAKNRPLLATYLRAEATNARTDLQMIPDTSIRQLSGMEANQRYVDELEQTAPANSLTWLQLAGEKPVPDPINGQFNSLDAANGFQKVGKRGPVYGDRAMFEMQSYYMEAGRDLDKALELFKRDARAYADRGVTIMLVSSTAIPEFRTMASQWLLSGEAGYVPYGSTVSVFIPREGPSLKTRTQESSDSTRISTKSFTGDNITVRALGSSTGTFSGENTVQADPKYDPEYLAAAHTVVPSYLTGTDGSTNAAYAFGWPKGLTKPTSEMAVLEVLRAALNNPKMYAHLLKQLGEDPPNVPIFKKHPNGTFDPGMLGRDEALKQFKDLVDAGLLPGIGQKVMTGGLTATVTSDGTILLERLGFKPPNHNEMVAQKKAQPEGRKGAAPLKVVVSTNKFDDNWTISPWFVITEIHEDINGVHLYGEYEQHYLSKWTDVLGAFKAAQAPIPMTGQFPTEVPLGNQADKPIRITSRGPAQEEESKAAKREGLINNFRNAFALSGWDARPHLLRFFKIDTAGMTNQEFEEAWNKLSDMLNEYAKTTNFTPDQVQEALNKGRFDTYIQSSINEIRDAVKPLGFQPLDITGKPVPVADPQDFIARRVLAVMGMEGVSLADVAYSKGLIDVERGEAVTLLPDMLAASFINTKHPEVFQFLVDEINDRTAKPGTDGKPAFFLHNDWTWDIQYDDRKDGGSRPLVYREMLQIVLPIPAKESIAANIQAVINRGPNASSTPHSALINAVALGGRLQSDKDLERGGRFGNDNMVEFGDAAEERGFYDMLSNVSKEDNNYVRQPKNLPLMQRFADRALTKTAAYHHRLDKSDWDNAMSTTIRDEFLSFLNLDKVKDRDEVDYLVRQFWGAPGPIHGQKDYEEQITEKLYIKAVTFMLYNVRQKQMHPLHGGVVPMEHKVFWERLYKAQIGAEKPWAPVAEEGGKLKKKRGAETWDQWATTLVAQMRESDASFSTVFAIDIAGFWQSYQGSMSQYDITSMSPNLLKNMAMMDPDANEYLLSIDPNVNALLSDPMLLDTVDKTLDALTGMTADSPDIGTLAPSAMSLGDRAAHVTKWQKKQGLARRQKNQSFRSYMREGQLYLESDRELNVFAASIIHLQIINRLFNPALWVSALIEVPIRAALEHSTDILTGNHAGAGGIVLSQAIEKSGWNPRYTKDDILAIRSLAPTLGASNELSAEVFNQYINRFAYQGQGSVVNKLAQVAGRTALLFADPRRGMRNATVGRLYLNGVLEYLGSTNSSVGVRQIVGKLAADPMYLAKEAERGGDVNIMNAHQAGLNRFAQTRGFRRTFTGNMIMTPVDAMLGSSSNIVQMGGAFLWIPFAFTSFTANVFIMLTGQQATDQMMARLFDQRANWFSRLSAVVRGSNYDPERHDHIDMTDVLDGMDLSRAFIQSGISWTTLFTMGSLAAAANLGGEDDEERKRRKMAEQLNLPTYIDPIKKDDGSVHEIGGAEFDFRQADAIYLDDTFLGSYFENADGRSAVVPHWIVRQYTSPMMGMTKFFDTGDLRYLREGFLDAARVIPYSSLTLWRQANESFDIMSGAIKETEEVNTPDSAARRRTLLTSTVGMLERTLVSNQFVDALWQASDDVDRAGWVVADTNETGQILREPGTGFPMAEQDALQPTVFTDPLTGEPTAVGATYMKREQGGPRGVEAHMRAERSFSWAVLSSLFTGQWNPAESSFNRFNMVPRGREVPLAQVDPERVETVLYTAFTASGGQKNLTEGEVVRILRHQAEAAGQRWDQGVLEARAQKIVETGTGPGALSVLDASGVETVTEPGMDAVLTGLANGSITMDSPAMRGIWATRETLKSIEATWKDRLEKESVSYGMTKAEADYRWRRFWWGDPDDPEAPGLKYLFDQIPSEPDARYVQLNVTYAMGPDGRPWATPFTRQTVYQALGLPFPHTMAQPGKGLTMDSRANMVDEVLGINTGLNALMKAVEVPEEEQERKLQNATNSNTPYSAGKFRRFPRRSFGRGGGGSGYLQRPDFIRMLPLPETRMTPRPDDIPFINTNTPYVRRSRIQEDRITSERGRLKQWQ